MSCDINGVMSGNAGFNVSGGGILGGTGQVTALTVQGSTVQPGSAGLGSLRVHNGATFYPNSTFSATIDGAVVNSSLGGFGGPSTPVTLRITGSEHRDRARL